MENKPSNPIATKETQKKKFKRGNSDVDSRDDGEESINPPILEN